MADQEQALAQQPTTCECGFAREVCATNPCMRKKVHLAGLTPGSKWSEGANAWGAALQTIERTTFSGSEMDEAYMRGNRDAHATCASIARSALAARSPAASEPAQGVGDSGRSDALRALDEMKQWSEDLWRNAKRAKRYSDDGVTQDGAGHIADAVDRWLKPLRAAITAPLTPAASEVERLQEHCEAYKGQVEAGAAEIARLTAQVERAHRFIRDAGLGQHFQYETGQSLTSTVYQPEPAGFCPCCNGIATKYPDGRRTCVRCEWEEAATTNSPHERKASTDV